jgi:hypothetical protein
MSSSFLLLLAATLSIVAGMIFFVLASLYGDVVLIALAGVSIGSSFLFLKLSRRVP